MPPARPSGQRESARQSISWLFMYSRFRTCPVSPRNITCKSLSDCGKRRNIYFCEAMFRCAKLALLGLEPLLYFWPEIAHVAFEMAAEINVISLLPRHRPGAALDLAQVFD
jgi:hypothetical protein